MPWDGWQDLHWGVGPEPLLELRLSNQGWLKLSYVMLIQCSEKTNAYLCWGVASSTTQLHKAFKRGKLSSQFLFNFNWNTYCDTAFLAAKTNGRGSDRHGQSRLLLLPLETRMCCSSLRWAQRPSSLLLEGESCVPPSSFCALAANLYQSWC